jgi:hypothetical protein
LCGIGVVGVGVVGVGVGGVGVGGVSIGEVYPSNFIADSRHVFSYPAAATVTATATASTTAAAAAWESAGENIDQCVLRNRLRGDGELCPTTAQIRAICVTAESWAAYKMRLY